MKKTDPKIKREMTRLFNKFVATLDNEIYDEYWGPPASMAMTVYEDFQKWLKKEEKNEKD